MAAIPSTRPRQAIAVNGAKRAQTGPPSVRCGGFSRVGSGMKPDIPRIAGRSDRVRETTTVDVPPARSTAPLRQELVVTRDGPSFWHRCHPPGRHCEALLLLGASQRAQVSERSDSRHHFTTLQVDDEHPKISAVQRSVLICAGNPHRSAVGLRSGAVFDSPKVHSVAHRHGDPGHQAPSRSPFQRHRQTARRCRRTEQPGVRIGRRDSEAA